MKIRKEIIWILASVFSLSAVVIAGSIQLPKTGQTTSYYPGDDGAIRSGVPWPNPRFSDNGDCITDNLTGLMWAKDANLPNGQLAWHAALNYANDLTLCNYSDWRLPNINELESLINVGVADSTAWLNGVGFINIQKQQDYYLDSYWTSSNKAGTNLKWVQQVWSGFSYGYSYTQEHHYVWPVRAATTPPAQLWKTGQTISYYAGDDGDIQAGVSWPDPRFSVNGDFVLDNLTGLMWLKDINCMNTRYPSFGDGYVTWEHALDFVAGINNGLYSDCGAGYADWRVPNRTELLSLFTINNQDSYLPPGHPFTNLTTYSHIWTSTTYATDSTYAWLFDTDTRYCCPYWINKKSYTSIVWPVRSGQMLSLAPVLTSPSNGDAVNGREFILDWEPVANAVLYEIRLDNNTGFGSPEINRTIEAPDTSFTLVLPFPDNTYYWKVRAKFADGTYTLWAVPWHFTYTLPVNPEPVWVPLYRLYNSTIKDHYYTTIPAHRDDYVKNKQYKYERIEGYISDRKFNDPDCGYLFHLWDKTNDIHFYTSDTTEKDNKIIAGFSYEGIVGFIYTQPFEWGTSLYRLYKAANTDYFYTISDFERDHAISAYGFANDGSMTDVTGNTIVGYISATGILNPESRLKFNIAAGYGTNTGNGAFNYSHTDMKIPGIGMPVVFSRIYNSLNFGADGPLGYGWTHSYNAKLTDDGNKVYVYWPDGHTDYYVHNGTNMTEAYPAVCGNPGCYDTLYISTSGDTFYTITKKDQTQYIFRIPADTVPDPAGAPSSSARFHKIIERNGNYIVFGYDINTGDLVTITGDNGLILTLWYYTNSEGHLGHIKSIAGTGRTIYFGYDADDNLTSVTDTRGNTTTFGYDSNHQMQTVTLPEGQVLTNNYDSFKISDQTLAGNKFGFTYLDGVTTVVDPVQQGTSLKTEYSIAGDQLQNITDPMNYGIPLSFDVPNNPTKPTQVIDRNGNITLFTYDSGINDANKKILQKGNLLSVTNDLGHTTSFTYDDMNNLVSVRDVRGNFTLYDYDAAKKNLVKVTYPEGGIVNITYSAKGQVETITDPNTSTITYSYDTYGNVTRITDENTNHVDFTYDDVGRLLTATDQLNRRTRYAYDGNDNRTEVENADNKTAFFTYDRNNRLTRIRDFRNRTTDFVYNNMNLLERETDPESKSRQYAYDGRGRLTSITDHDGHVTSYDYDANGRMTAIKYDSATKVSFTLYDANGNLKTMTDDNGTTNSSFTYDDLNRITGYKDKFDKTVFYAYDDPAGRRYLTYPDAIVPSAKIVTYVFDKDNRLSTVTDWLGGTTTYDYYPAGILRSVINPNGSKVDYAYDIANRLTGLSNKKSDNSVISDYVFTLNKVGNPEQVVKNEPLSTVVTAENVSSAYDNANRITSSGSVTYTHDNRGNLTGTSAGNSYNYDYADRLIQATISGQTTQYSYDGFGNRISRTQNNIETRYVLDLNGSMSNVLAETDTGGNISNYYVYGLGLISKITSADQRYVYHYDSIGNTVAITDSSGNITEKYAYDEFGKATSDPVNSLNPFRYVGKFGVMDEGNDLLFMRARYYDVANGRFINKDPLGFGGGDLNLYAYVGGNPNYWIDPQGRKKKVRDFFKEIGADLVKTGKSFIQGMKEGAEFLGGGIIQGVSDGSKFLISIFKTGTNIAEEQVHMQIHGISEGGEFIMDLFISGYDEFSKQAPNTTSLLEFLNMLYGNDLYIPSTWEAIKKGQLPNPLPPGTNIRVNVKYL